jgi:hypothetical protein
MTSVRFEVLTAASIKMTIALMMEAASTSETSVNFYQTTRRNNPERQSSSTMISVLYRQKTPPVQAMHNL